MTNGEEIQKDEIPIEHPTESGKVSTAGESTSEEITYEKIKQISEEYIRELKGISGIRIIFAKQVNAHWKVVVRYDTSENPDILSMLMIDKKEKKVDYFREGITSF